MASRLLRLSWGHSLVGRWNCGAQHQNKLHLSRFEMAGRLPTGKPVTMPNPVTIPNDVSAYNEVVASIVSDKEFLTLAAEAGEVGIRVEISGQLPIWEMMPSPMHMLDAQAISETIRPAPNAANSGCGCFHAQDMAIRFPDGSIRRPDISIFCTRPARTREAATLIPTAVVEVVSPTSHEKDIVISPPFYLSHGVRDVFVYNPETLTVIHFTSGPPQSHPIPTEFETASGCLVAFPLPPDNPSR